MTHAYICECDRPRCRERIYLTVGQWRGLAALGRVVTPEHVDADVIRRTLGAAVVRELPARRRRRESQGRAS